MHIYSINMETTTDRLTRMMEESQQRMIANQLRQIQAFENGHGLQNIDVDMDEWKTLSISIKLLIMHLQSEVEDLFYQIENIRVHLESTPI